MNEIQVLEKLSKIDYYLDQIVLFVARKNRFFKKIKSSAVLTINLK